jgi:MFS family permease
MMQLMGGFLADRFRLNILLAIAAAGYGAAVLLLARFTSELGAHVFAACFGVGLGLSGVASTTSYARFFGRQSLGKIRGAVWSATVAGSSLGPVALGAGYEHLGSYAPTLWVFSGSFALLAVAALFSTRPRVIESPVSS